MKGLMVIFLYVYIMICMLFDAVYDLFNKLIKRSQPLAESRPIRSIS
jgi:hypothetical protein